MLKDLPKKTERIEWCEMTTHQRNIYNDALNRSRKTIFDLESEASTPGMETPPVNGRVKPLKKPKAPRTKDRMYLENSSNVLMDLRKAASHPMLFRTRYTDKALDAITKVLLREADFKKRGAVAQYVKEDMEVMTDAELQVFLGSYLVRSMASEWFKSSLASLSRPKDSCRTRTVTSKQARSKHFYDC